MPYDQIRRHRYRVSFVFALLAAVLLIGWAIAIRINWDDILSSHARLGSFIADLVLTLPLCILTYMGLQREAAWAPAVSMLAMGALAYATIHVGVFLIQIHFLGLPAVAYLLLMTLILFVLFRLAYWEVRLARLSPAPR